MADLYGLTEELHKSMQTGMYYYVSATKPDSGGSSVVETVQVMEGSDRVVATESWNRVTTAKARFRLKSVTDKHLSQIGVTNPLSLAWELVPYSFVIDWFIPVGDYLGSFDALVGVDSLSYYTSYKLEREFQASSSMGTSKAKWTYKVRSDLSSDLPLGALPLPSLPERHNAGKLANAVALLRQLR
jgi:hypothetical protein